VRRHEPACNASVTVQLADPSLTVTVSPFGTVPDPGALAETLIATEYDCPKTVAPERSLVIEVLVLTLLTICETAPDVLVAKFVFPL